MPSQVPTKKRTFRRLKQFRCDGFGGCNMVFSRSEHLARHIRKHTGEKPFKCEYPSCTKQFSRFDNMRQHAQTHQKPKTKNGNSEEVNIQVRHSELGQQVYMEGGRVGPRQPRYSNRNTHGDEQHTGNMDFSPSSSDHSQNGLVSPVSLSGSFEEQQNNTKKHQAQRQQQDCSQGLDGLTQDELDALDALNQFRQSPQATSS
ncbi:hypothetical protein BCR42DRAFT_118863 [Absidia repens]|uniref:C2H2-type domain-containing protein n=1 Tax=Absidia repens TaxID=90262 RepID=A0A1X2I579_9FUNG|nr:hypothetical protein BCR42DRAFT_118863 [Absidia repens]